MAEEQLHQRIRVVCTECPYSKVVEKDGGRSAKVIIEHGRETGHKLTTEDVNGE